MIRRRNPNYTVLIWLLLWSSVPAQQPQSNDPVEGATASVRAQVTADREKSTVELAAAKAAWESASVDGRSAPETLVRKLDSLNRLDLLYGQILAALNHETELRASKTQLTTDIETLRANGPTEPRPFPFALLENLRDRLDTATAREQSRAEATEAATASLADARAMFDQKERARRQAREASENNSDDARTPVLATELHLVQLESRLTGEDVRLREIELSNQRLEGELRPLQLTLLQEKIDHVASDVGFRQQGLDEYLAQIDQLEFHLTQASQWAQFDFSVRDSEWIEARRQLEASATKEPELVEAFEASQLARRARQREVALIGEQLQALADVRKVWNRRFQLFNLEAGAAVQEWETETRQTLDQLHRDLRINSARLTELRRETITLDAKINASGDAGPRVRGWLDQQKRHLTAMIRNYEETVEQLESARRLHDKLLSELTTQIDTITWSERLRSLWEGVTAIWNYEITSIQDSPITVRKVVVGILLLLTGLYLSRISTRWFGKRFLPRLGLNEGAIAAIQSMLFYLLVLTVVMLSLRVINVPLTAFTIFGGALAIGIGFGSQSIVNNFISGLILLAERPIRVGDLVQIDDLVGVVEHIGTRSTRVRSPENRDIIVPNSSFLEKNVVNWTLSDDRYRTHIVVGVMYGSPVRDVIRLIRRALREHGKVLPKPEPIVLFADFGDSALIFEAHFWIRMRRLMDCRVVESDIRARVDALFREAGIVIAFPQQDVHLDSQSPIQVRLIPNK